VTEIVTAGPWHGKTVVESACPSASTVISGARSDLGPDMERISLLSLFPVAVTGPQPSGPTRRARTVTHGNDSERDSESISRIAICKRLGGSQLLLRGALAGGRPGLSGGSESLSGRGQMLYTVAKNRQNIYNSGK
jgi:hypothetical protein